MRTRPPTDRFFVSFFVVARSGFRSPVPVRKAIPFGSLGCEEMSRISERFEEPRLDDFAPPQPRPKPVDITVSATVQKVARVIAALKAGLSENELPYEGTARYAILLETFLRDGDSAAKVC